MLASTVMNANFFIGNLLLAYQNADFYLVELNCWKLDENWIVDEDWTKFEIGENIVS